MQNRLTITLQGEPAARLRREAEKADRSIAWLVRRAIERVYSEAQEGDRVAA